MDGLYAPVEARAEGPKGLVVPDALTEAVLRIEGNTVEIVKGESKHIAALYLERLRAMLTADLVYHNAHLYLQQRHLDSWLKQLDDVEAFARPRVSTMYPGHGAAADLRLIRHTRQYLHDFAEAIKTGNAAAAEAQMLAKYPEHHVRQFLTVFSIPSYFPATS